MDGSETRYTSFGQTDKTLLWKSVADYQTGTDSLARVTSFGYDERGNEMAWAGSSKFANTLTKP